MIVQAAVWQRSFVLISLLYPKEEKRKLTELLFTLQKLRLNDKMSASEKNTCMCSASDECWSCAGFAHDIIRLPSEASVDNDHEALLHDIMCVSNEQCQSRIYRPDMLAWWGLYISRVIGRMPVSQKNLWFFWHALRTKLHDIMFMYSNKVGER